MDLSDRPSKKRRCRDAMSGTLPSAAALVVSTFLISLYGLYFGTGQHGFGLFLFYLRQPRLIILNTLPFIILSVLLWLVLKRTAAAFSVCSAVCLLYSWANYWKLLSRSDPIMAEDLTVVGTAAEFAGDYISVTCGIILSLAAAVLLTVVLERFFKGRPGSLLLRAAAAAAVIAACVPLLSKVYLNGAVYDSFSCWSGLNSWFTCSQFISRGSVYPFIYSINTASPKPPEGYAADRAEELLSAFETDDIPEEKKVNILCIMLEAFCDLSEYTDRLDGADAYGCYRDLRDSSYSGRLTTSIFAGGTVDTERKVLTGFTYLNSLRRPSWSYARYFRDQGYCVTGAHAGYEAFYNRVNVNENLGLDGYLFIENHFSRMLQGVPPDSVFMPEITRLFLETAESGQNIFSYNVTYQGHGPYSNSAASFEKEYISRESAGCESTYMIVNNYLASVEDTGFQLSQTVRDLERSDEPAVLLVFADHKPWLGDQSGCYADLGIDLSSESEESFFNKYDTEYIIWANSAAKEATGSDFSGTGRNISPNYLMNEVFELCGWEGPSFLKFSNSVRDILPIITSAGSYSCEGRFGGWDVLTDAGIRALSDIKTVQFYLQRDSEGKLPE